MASNDSEPNRPLIGITGYLEQARYGAWDQPAALVPRGYADGVARAGGIPVVLPPIGDGAAELARRLDGLVLAGGADVDPAHYRASAHPRSTGLCPDRDAFEFALLDAALELGVPVLAVCRSMQLLNVAAGGSLHQHLPEQVGHDGHRPGPGRFGSTHVQLAPDSALAAILGTETTVACCHHQAIAELAATLRSVGTAPDGTCEAVELPGRAFVLGVQWHPEENAQDDRLFAALVAAAGKPASLATGGAR